jgi:hypothetical protein
MLGWAFGYRSGPTCPILFAAINNCSPYYYSPFAADACRLLPYTATAWSYPIDGGGIGGGAATGLVGRRCGPCRGWPGLYEVRPRERADVRL